MTIPQYQDLAKLIRYFILVSTTAAGSGHPTSSLSAVELMAVLMFGGFFKYNLEEPEYENNDRLIFSKGHASPLFYALYAAAGKVSLDELKTLRKFGSNLEGHPTRVFPYTEVATGSLGQGLSAGVGMALNAKYLDKSTYRTYVLLGDSEMAEGSVWEAAQLAAHYKLDNLVGILDVNRLGQRGETMCGWNTESYEQKLQAFGWSTVVVNGHSVEDIAHAYTFASESDKPCMIIAKTVKGKGVSLIENKEGWHGKSLSPEELEKALEELGKVDLKLRGKIAKSDKIKNKQKKVNIHTSEIKVDEYKTGQLVSTRKAYGNAVVKLGEKNLNIVVLDGEVSNSTYAEVFKKVYPERFFEMFIAEQNMVGTALGLARRGKKPFVSTFGAFFSRAFDQIRMSAYSEASITFVGSHAGVSIGEDGVSQMALEDIALFRSVYNSVVLYPSDAVATEQLVAEAGEYSGVSYVRTTRKDLPVLYNSSEKFIIGGSKVLKQSPDDAVTLIAAGITLHEVLSAYEALKKQGIIARVIDLYSIKPLDTKTLFKAAEETQALVTVEDHYLEGGVGEAIRSSFAILPIPLVSLGVKKMPHSGKSEELLEYEGISARAIVKEVKRLLK
jgi:transketolase